MSAGTDTRAEARHMLRQGKTWASGKTCGGHLMSEGVEKGLCRQGKGLSLACLHSKTFLGLSSFLILALSWEAQLQISPFFKGPSAWMFLQGPATCCYPVSTKLEWWFTWEVFASDLAAADILGAQPQHLTRELNCQYPGNTDGSCSKEPYLNRSCILPLQLVGDGLKSRWKYLRTANKIGIELSNVMTCIGVTRL